MDYRHHTAQRETRVILVPVPCGGTPESIRGTKPKPYPRDRREHWNGPPRRISNAESLARFMRRIAEQDAEVKRMMPGNG